MFWSIYAMLGQNMWFTEHPELDFDEAAWDELLHCAAENGFDRVATGHYAKIKTENGRYLLLWATIRGRIRAICFGD